MQAAGPLGLLGGSFDPVHAGHLQLATDACNALRLSQLRLIPVGRAWQKDGLANKPTAADHRVAMLRLAIQGRCGWTVDTREIERPGPSYTIDTLRQLRTLLGPRQPLVWILGSDQLQRLTTWQQWQSLTDYAHLAYAQRPGVAPNLAAELAAWVGARRSDAQALAQQPAGCCVEFAMQAIDCSATRIRQELAAREPTAARFLPGAVVEYICTHRLYAGGVT